MRWSEFPRPIVCLAPMDGVTNTACRQVVRRLNPEVVLFSEFTSVDGLVRSEHVRQRLDHEPCEHPLFMQLFGNAPETFAEASRMVADCGMLGVDINMGCPAKKIVHSQHGSALMREPDLACRIIDAVREASGLEVSVKTRLGWSDASELIPFAKRLESAGASLLTIHGRTYHQAFKGEADWEPIYELKKHLAIPLLGNGDVANHTHGLRKLRNLDGFMIGRAAIGDPWVFRHFAKTPPPALVERIDVAVDHYHLLRKLRPERAAVPEFRKYLGNYLSGFRRAKEWRIRLMQCKMEMEFLAEMATLRKYVEPLPDSLPLAS